MIWSLYLYFPTRQSVKYGEQGIVQSKTFAPTQATCMSFYFHMYGYHMGSLKIYIQKEMEISDGYGKKVWERSKGHGKLWLYSNVTITSNTRFKILFVATKGGSYLSQIALDDISFVNYPCFQSSTEKANTCIFLNTSDKVASCSALKKMNPSTKSGTYSINLKGETNPAVKVYCDMSTKNGVGVTEIGHDSQSSIKVDDYEKPGSYKRTIKYTIAMDQIVALINQSKNCEQFVKYDCYKAGFWFNKPYGWWVSRQGFKMLYWGGAQPNSGKCACGMTNSCLVPSKRCNCDQNLDVWSEDSGYLTDKNALPVMGLRFGDTGKLYADNEIGYHTIGKLRCWD